MKTCALLLLAVFLTVACALPMPASQNPPAAAARAHLVVAIPEERGLSGDLQVAGVLVRVLDGSQAVHGRGSLTKSGSGWSGSIDVDAEGLFTIEAQAVDGNQWPLWEGQASTSISASAANRVSMALSLLPSAVGDRHPSLGKGSALDVSGASFERGARFSGGYGGSLEVAVYSGHATKVLLELYSVATGKRATLDYWMVRGADDLWRARIDLDGNTGPVLYGLRAWGPNWGYDASWTRGNSSSAFVADVDASGNRFNPNKVLTDPYARELSHDRVTPAFLGAGETKELYLSGGTDVDPTQTYTSALTKGLPLSRREVDSGLWAPKSVALIDSTDFGAKPALAPQDSVIYEAHVRGLTKHPSSTTLTALLADFSGFAGVTDVPDAYRGTYRGAGYLAGYLKALGLNTIELLPVQETSNDAQPADASGGNYWGYMTDGYFAPDRRYSYDQSLGGPTREFKQMVKAFHDAGIEVYLDVVYNHTGEEGTVGSPSSAAITGFRGLDNAGYYALKPLDKALYWETTGCGNNLDASLPAVRSLVLDSLTYWERTMGVDGFRFDLAPVLGRQGPPNFDYGSSAPLLTAIASLGASDSVEMVAEPWDTGWPSGYQVSNFPSGWSEWNGFYRDAVRKFAVGGGNKTSGYPSFADVFNGSYGPLDRSSGHPHTGFADQGGPQRSVNFLAAHDGFTLADLVSYDAKTNGGLVAPAWPFGPSDGGSDDNDSSSFGGDQRIRRQVWRSLWTTQIFSRGVPMILAGDEFGRTQNGNNNAYNVDSVGTWLNWGQIASDSPQTVSTGGAGTYNDSLGTDPHSDGKNGLFTFAQRLLNLRKSEPALRQADYAVAYGFTKADGTSLTDGDRAVRVHIDGSSVAGGSDYLVCVNTWTGTVTFSLPPPDAGTSWVRIIDTAEWSDANAVDQVWTDDEGWGTGAGTFGVGPWSTVVFKAVGVAGAPVLGTEPGTFVPASTAPVVAFTSSTPGAVFRWTLDGSDPLGAGASLGSSCTIPPTPGTYTLSVVATKAGLRPSAVGRGTYVVADAPPWSHTPTFDGTIGGGEYAASETFASSSAGYTLYLTWDATYLYLGYLGDDVSAASEAASKFLVAYLGQPGGTGTTEGIAYGSQQFTLPFAASTVVNWRTDWGDLNSASSTGGAWAWTNPLSLVLGTDLKRDWSAKSLELRLARSRLGDPRQVNLLVHFVTTAGNWTYGIAPSAAASDGNDPTPARYFQFDLTAAEAPGSQSGTVKP